jgi:hypothetical protein
MFVSWARFAFVGGIGQGCDQGRSGSPKNLAGFKTIRFVAWT